MGRSAEIAGVPWLTLLSTLALRGLTHPPTGVALVRVAWRFRRRDWWRRVPFLPVPDSQYLQWRMHTAYGSHHAVPPAADVIRYARWAVRQD